jgi:hypothetical protein
MKPQRQGGIRLDRLGLFLLVIFGIGYAVTDHRTDAQKAADAAEARLADLCEPPAMLKPRTAPALREASEQGRDLST